MINPTVIALTKTRFLSNLISIKGAGVLLNHQAKTTSRPPAIRGPKPMANAIPTLIKEKASGRLCGSIIRRTATIAKVIKAEPPLPCSIRAKIIIPRLSCLLNPSSEPRIKRPIPIKNSLRWLIASASLP